MSTTKGPKGLGKGKYYQAAVAARKAEIEAARASLDRDYGWLADYWYRRMAEAIAKKRNVT